MTAPREPVRRVVITGIGIVCPLGLSPAALWQAVSSGQSGVRPLVALPRDGLPTSFAGECLSFDGSTDNFGPLRPDVKRAIRKGLKLMCRECQMGVAAAQLALSDAGVESASVDPTQAGVIFGTDYMVSDPRELAGGIAQCLEENEEFSYTRWGNEGITKIAPLWLLKYLPNMPASHVAIYNDFRGPNSSLTHREAAANLSLGEAATIIARGSADMMTAGATGTLVHPTRSMHAAQQSELAGNGWAPEAASRPFDLQRGGMVLGEGAAAVVLEELETATKRGAAIYGEVVGAGSSSVSSRKLVARRDVALANAMHAALASAGMQPGDVGHIHAHGLSTRSCDRDEWLAIEQVFDGLARRIPLVAAKSYFGNLGAGSGGVELISSLIAFEKGELFRVLNYERPDPDCPVNAVTEAGVPPGPSVMNLNVTPQGQASCLIVRAVE